MEKMPRRSLSHSSTRLKFAWGYGAAVEGAGLDGEEDEEKGRGRGPPGFDRGDEANELVWFGVGGTLRVFSGAVGIALFDSMLIF
jgi:hypothetical protein